MHQPAEPKIGDFALLARFIPHSHPFYNNFVSFDSDCRNGQIKFIEKLKAS